MSLEEKIEDLEDVLTEEFPFLLNGLSESLKSLKDNAKEVSEELKSRLEGLAEQSILTLQQVAKKQITEEDGKEILKRLRIAFNNYIDTAQIEAGKAIASKFESLIDDVLVFVGKLVIGFIV